MVILESASEAANQLKDLLYSLYCGHFQLHKHVGPFINRDNLYMGNVMRPRAMPPLEVGAFLLVLYLLMALVCWLPISREVIAMHSK